MDLFSHLIDVEDRLTEKVGIFFGFVQHGLVDLDEHSQNFAVPRCINGLVAHGLQLADIGQIEQSNQTVFIEQYNILVEDIFELRFVHIFDLLIHCCPIIRQSFGREQAELDVIDVLLLDVQMQFIDDGGHVFNGDVVGDELVLIFIAKQVLDYFLLIILLQLFIPNYSLLQTSLHKFLVRF